MSLRRGRPLEEALRLVRARATSGLGGAARLFRSGPAAGLPERDRRRLAAQLDACLQPRLGEVIARARAAEVADTYLGLDGEGRARFFAVLADQAGLDADAVNRALDDYDGKVGRIRPRPVTPAQRVAAAATLRRALTPGWERLFELLCGLDDGVKLAVDLRADLLVSLAAARRGEGPDGFDPDLVARVDDDLRAHLKQLFDVGLLELHQVTWQTPAAFLEKLIAYEAVHEITSWDDLKNRLRPDRRCFAFVHPGMPSEPLIFVEVALVQGIAERIPPLLDLNAPLGDPAAADTAIFYSISACQDGLAGVSLGDFLIKRVVTDLTRDLPGLKQFATLSPIPGFRAWLAASLERAADVVVAVLTPEQRDALAGLAPGSGVDGPAGGLHQLLADSSWADQPPLAEAARPALVRLAAHYLAREQRDGRAADRVANFHLSNGARIERVNWLANPTPAGMKESLGMMVNYRYDLGRIESNHTDYVLRGRVVTSATVSRVLS